jgi:peptide/nickel transport system substrate-binding protein
VSFPTSGENPLLYGLYQPFPNWVGYSVWQSLVDANLTAEYSQGVIQYLPVLASNWTISSNDMSMTFTIRQNVTFSTGDQFNAYEAWAALNVENYISGNGSNILADGQNVFNSGAFDFGPSTLALLASTNLNSPDSSALAVMENSSQAIYVTGPYSLVFQFSNPYSAKFFLALASSGQYTLWDVQYVLQNGGVGTPGNPNTAFDTTPVPGTGPYMMTSISQNTYIKLSQNPTYWGDQLPAAEIKGNPVLDPGEAPNVIIKAVSNDVVRYSDLSSGDAQLAAIEAQDWSQVVNNPMYAYANSSKPAEINFLAMNTQKYPTNITDVRLAIAYAINYTQIDDQVFDSKAIRIFGPETPYLSQWYDPGGVQPYQMNVSKAEQLLTAAGFPGGKGIPTMQIWYPTSGFGFDPADFTPMSEIIVSNLAAIGITVQVVQMNPSEYFAQAILPYSSMLNNSQSLPNLLPVIGWAPGFIYPLDYWGSFVCNCSVGGNEAIYSNPIVNNAIDLFTQTNNMTQLLAAMAKAEQQLYNDAPVAWISSSTLLFGSGSYVWNKNIISGMYFDQNYAALDEVPLINTITFVGHSQS